MPGSVALLFSLTFSVAFLVRDASKTSAVSRAVWVPTLWLILSISKPVSYWLSPGSYSAASAGSGFAEGSPIDRLVLTLLMSVALLLLGRRHLNWARWAKRNGMVVALFAFMLVSVTWSGYPTVALRRYMRAIGDILMAVVVLSEEAPFEAVKAMLRRAAYVLLPLSVVLIKFYRVFGIAYSWSGAEMWTGVAWHKNGLGALACVFALYCIMDFLHTRHQTLPSAERFGRLVLFGISLWLLWGSHSATSLGVFLIGLVVLTLSLVQKRNPRHVGALNAFVILGSVAVLLLSSALLSSAVMAYGRDMTFTGRTEIWAEFLRVGSRHPLLGVGYGSLWIGDLAAELLQGAQVNEAHNGYIEVYVELGLAGVLLVVWMIVRSYGKIAESIPEDFHYSVFRMVYLVAIVVYNVTETSFLAAATMLWFLFLVVTMEPPTTGVSNQAGVPAVG